MTKGYCDCGKVIDQVEFFQFGMCEVCFTAKRKLPKINIKFKKLKIRRGDSVLYYVCNIVKWNYWLNRYYPHAELDMVIIDYKPNDLRIT